MVPEKRGAGDCGLDGFVSPLIKVPQVLCGTATSSNAFAFFYLGKMHFFMSQGLWYCSLCMAIDH